MSSRSQRSHPRDDPQQGRAAEDGRHDADLHFAGRGDDAAERVGEQNEAGPDEGWEPDGNREEGPVTAIVTSIYWALLIVAYFLWSFLGEGWGISWIIWPVGGVLFGAIHTVVDTLETRRRKRSR